MPYAAVSDVRGLIPSVPIDAQSLPSEGTVQTWIADVERMLNVTLENSGFTVPVTGPNAIAVLKQMVSHAVAAMVLRARPNPETDPETFQRWYDARIKALRDPADPFDLPSDAVRTAGTVVKDTGGLLRVRSSMRQAILDDDDLRITRDQVF